MTLTEMHLGSHCWTLLLRLHVNTIDMFDLSSTNQTFAAVIQLLTFCVNSSPGIDSTDSQLAQGFYGLQTYCCGLVSPLSSASFPASSLWKMQQQQKQLKDKKKCLHFIINILSMIICDE